MLHSGGTRIAFLWVLPICHWGAQGVFETWGSECEEEEEEEKAHRPQILPPPKLLGMQFAGGIALVSPGILAMAWFILEPELLGAPSHTSCRGPTDAYPHAPRNGIFQDGDTWSCWAILLGSFSCCPLPAVSHYLKMDLELISPMPLSIHINLPALLIPGVPAELLLGVTGASLGFGRCILGGIQVGLGLGSMCCCACPLPWQRPIHL